jgi:hypothetical protein
MAKTRYDESVARGGKIRTETGPEREDKLPQISDKVAILGTQLSGGESDLSHSIRGNKVARPGEKG